MKNMNQSNGFMNQNLYQISNIQNQKNNYIFPNSKPQRSSSKNSGKGNSNVTKNNSRF